MSTLVFAPAFTFLVHWQASSGPNATAAQLLSLAISALSVVALAALFAKAGQPAWAALVPLYDLIVVLRIAGRPWWWLFLLLVPLVNVVVFLFVCLDLARAFGRSAAFGVGLLALAPICQLILAFGSAQYAPRERAGLPHPAPIRCLRWEEKEPPAIQPALSAEPSAEALRLCREVRTTLAEQSASSKARPTGT